MIIEAIVIICIILALAVLAKVGGIEPLFNGFIAVIGFIFSLALTIVVIAGLCMLGLFCIPLGIILLIGSFLVFLFDKKK